MEDLATTKGRGLISGEGSLKQNRHICETGGASERGNVSVKDHNVIGRFDNFVAAGSHDAGIGHTSGADADQTTAQSSFYQNGERFEAGNLVSRKENGTSNPGEASSILSVGLSDHYARHNVVGLEDFLCGSKDDSGVNFCRFVRLNPRFDLDDSLDLLRAELSSETSFPSRVRWIDQSLGFYAVPSTFKLSRSLSFQSGRVYGMDVTSGAAVAALLLDDYDMHQAITPKGNDQQLGTKEVAKDGRREKKISEGEGPDEERLNYSLHSPLRVLDLCCSPGLKLCAIVDLLQKRPGSTVTGVDISERRLSIAKNVLKKYIINPLCNRGLNAKCPAAGDVRALVATRSGGSGDDSMTKDSEGSCLSAIKCSRLETKPNVDILLYCADGTTFGTSPRRELVFHSSVAEDHARLAGQRKRMNKSARAREKAMLNELSRNLPTNELFDRVLVDAECSTDGALRHMQQIYQRQSMATKEEKKSGEAAGTATRPLLCRDNKMLTDGDRLAELVKLQQRLIASGFRLLKPGGVLVYSTCSLSMEQNEEVVMWLMEQYSSESFIIPVSFSVNMSLGTHDCDDFQSILREGDIKGTVKFVPHVQPSHQGTAFQSTSGFFLAKIGKKFVTY